MKTEYRLYHRITHKNGRVGDWVFDSVISSPQMVKFYVDCNKENAERIGKKVEHKIETREVSSWYEDNLEKVLKLAENKGVKNA